MLASFFSWNRLNNFLIAIGFFYFWFTKVYEKSWIFQTLYNRGLGFFYSIFGCFISLSTSFVLCYSGSRGSQTLISCGDAAYNVDWYSYPVNMQKITQLLIQRSQRTTRFKGLKILSCTIETFGKVSTKKINFVFFWNMFCSYLARQSNCFIFYDVSESFNALKETKQIKCTNWSQ